MTTQPPSALNPLAFGQDRVDALFLLAGFRLVARYRLANDYWPDDARYDALRRTSPWWLVQTDAGDMIGAGWRKRVLSLSWATSSLRVRVTTDDVTQDDTGVHAWNYAKAVEYLTTLRQAAEARDQSALTPTPAVARPALSLVPIDPFNRLASIDHNDWKLLRRPA